MYRDHSRSIDEESVSRHGLVGRSSDDARHDILDRAEWESKDGNAGERSDDGCFAKPGREDVDAVHRCE